MEQLLRDVSTTLPRADDAHADRVEQRRTTDPLDQTGLTLVTLDDQLYTMTRGDFEGSMERSDLAPRVSGLIEYWPDDDTTSAFDTHGDGVLRISGYDVPGDPQYFRGSLSDAVFIAGKMAYEGWAVAHASDSIHEGDRRHLETQRLFDDNGTHCIDNLQQDTSLREYIQSEEFQALLDHLDTLDEGEREAFLDDYFGYTDD